MGVHQAQESAVEIAPWRRTAPPLSENGPGSLLGLALALLASFAVVDAVMVGAPYVNVLADSGSWLIVATQSLTGAAGLVLLVTEKWRQFGIGLLGGSALACLAFLGLLLRIGLQLSS